MMKEVVGFVMLVVMVIGVIILVPSFQTYVVNGLSNDNLEEPSGGVMLEMTNTTGNMTSMLAGIGTNYVLLAFGIMFVMVMIVIFAYVRGVR